MKTNQKGFSAVEIILVVAVVGLIGAVGWLVYDRRHKGADTKAVTPETTKVVDKNTPKTEDTSNIPEAQAKYLVIKEWDVKIPLTEPISDAKYRIISEESAEIITTRLESYGCTWGWGSRLTRGLGGTVEYSGPITKIGEYYYGFIGTQSACNNGLEPGSPEELAAEKEYTVLMQQVGEAVRSVTANE